jgi:hypothetical protein
MITNPGTVFHPAGGLFEDADGADAGRKDENSSIGLFALLRKLEPIEEDFAEINDPEP